MEKPAVAIRCHSVGRDCFVDGRLDENLPVARPKLFDSGGGVGGNSWEEIAKIIEGVDRGARRGWARSYKNGDADSAPLPNVSALQRRILTATPTEHVSQDL